MGGDGRKKIKVPSERNRVEPADNPCEMTSRRGRSVVVVVVMGEEEKEGARGEAEGTKGEGLGKDLRQKGPGNMGYYSC